MVQVNSKLRGSILVAANAGSEDGRSIALASVHSLVVHSLVSIHPPSISIYFLPFPFIPLVQESRLIPSWVSIPSIRPWSISIPSISIWAPPFGPFVSWLISPFHSSGPFHSIPPGILQPSTSFHSPFPVYFLHLCPSSAFPSSKPGTKVAQPQALVRTSPPACTYALLGWA